jgi:Flp pilus assembly CpaE family ATPase
MDSESYAQLDTPLSSAFSTNVLSIALIGPDVELRKAAVGALSGCHDGEIREFSSYPPGLDFVPQLLEKQYDVIMIELDSNPEYALDLMEGICANRSATVMVYSKETDQDLSDPDDLLVRCMRAGAREFLSFPFSQDTMAEALVRAAARRPAMSVEKKTGGRLLVFCGAKGGVGVTSLACNFAVAMAQESSQSTLLIDLDLPLGDAALNLGIVAQYSTMDVLQNFSRLDSNFLSKFLVKHSSGISVLAAPGEFSPANASNEAINKLMTIARQDFENVVVDVGSKLDLKGTVLYDEATTIYLVTQAGVPELRNSNRLITKYFTADNSKLEIVLNRHQARGIGVSEDNIKKALTKAVKWKIPNDYIAVRRMQNTATPLTLSDSPISGSIGQMARSVCGIPEPLSNTKKKGFNFRGFGKNVIPSPNKSMDFTSLQLINDSDCTGITSHVASHDSPKNTASDSHARQEASYTDTATSKEHNEPDIRIYKGDTYLKGADGQWHLKKAQIKDTHKEKPTVEWLTPDPITYGVVLSITQLNATASDPGKFVYTPPLGYLLPAGTHTLWVTFTSTDDSDDATVQTKVALTVMKATPVITWSSPSDISYGIQLDSTHLNARSSVPGTFAYSHAEGDVLAEGTHILSVTFTPTDTANYTVAQAEVSLTVTKPIPVISWAKPTAISYGCTLSSAQLNATVSVPGTFIYSPSEGNKLPAGSHTLTVTFNPIDTTKYATAQASVVLVVNAATPTIRWSEPASICYGTSLSAAQLNATASVLGTFAYSPAEGEVLQSGQHVLSVIFTPADAVNYTTVSTNVHLAVTKAKLAIAWSAPDPIIYGTALGTAQLNATASVPGTFDYIPAVGAVLAAGKHTPSAIFRPTDTKNYTAAQAAVSLTVTKASPSITWPKPAHINYGSALSTKQLNATASIPGFFVYTPAEGDVLNAGEQTLSVTFTPTDTTNYTTAHAVVPIVVDKATPAAIAWPAPMTIPYGTALSDAELNASASVPGTFEYSHSKGTVLVAGKHSLSATFTPTDVNLPTGQATVSLTVAKATPIITWDAPAACSCGTMLSDAQLNATASVPGTFEYIPSAGYTLNAGKQTLSVIFTPKDTKNYAVAQADVPLIVAKVQPTITWTKPAPITYGTSLSATQLNASASIPGTFVYSPSLGTVLTAGTQTISVTFIPADAKNYAKVQTAVLLEVNRLPDMTFCSPTTFDPYEEDKHPQINDAIPVDQKRWTEDRTDNAISIGGTALALDKFITTAYAVEESSLASANRTTLQHAIPLNQSHEPEARTYKGVTYVKGADGQWHLQKR